MIQRVLMAGSALATMVWLPSLAIWPVPLGPTRIAVPSAFSAGSGRSASK